jgi:hypothetical protein
VSEDFGKEVTMVGLAVRGVLSVGDAARFAEECVAAIGMQVSHPNQVTVYPPRDGKDIGFLLLQPLIESYVIVDYWTCHEGFYLGVVSCKDFDMVDIETVVGRWGFKVRSVTGGYLSL